VPAEAMLILEKFDEDVATTRGGITVLGTYGSNGNDTPMSLASAGKRRFG